MRSQILFLLMLSVYVAITTGDPSDEHLIYWIQPTKNSNFHASKILGRNSIQMRRNQIKPMKKRNDDKRLPGSGFAVPSGFDIARVCATGYFLKNTMYALIQSLEYQKQMAMKLNSFFEGVKNPFTQTGSGTTTSSAGVGSLEGAGTSFTTGLSLETTSTTMSTVFNTTTAVPLSTSPNNSTTVPTPQSQTILTPAQVEELLNLVREILDILPEILHKFAAIEEANQPMEQNTSSEQEDSPFQDMLQQNVVEKKQAAVQRLTAFEDTMENFDLNNYTNKMTPNSEHLFIEIVHQAVTDLSILAPNDENVHEVMLLYADIL